MRVRGGKQQQLRQYNNDSDVEIHHSELKKAQKSAKKGSKMKKRGRGIASSATS